MGIVCTTGGQCLNAGYLKIERVLRGDEMRLKIPNEEVRMEFKSIVSAFLEVGENDIECIASGKAE